MPMAYLSAVFILIENHYSRNFLLRVKTKSSFRNNNQSSQCIMCFIGVNAPIPFGPLVTIMECGISVKFCVMLRSLWVILLYFVYTSELILSFNQVLIYRYQWWLKMNITHWNITIIKNSWTYYWMSLNGFEYCIISCCKIFKVIW